MSEPLGRKSGKILVLANHDVGLYQFRRELIQALLNDRYEVIIALPDGAMITPLIAVGCRFINTPVDRRGINPVTDLSLFMMYRRLIRENEPDIVITYTIKPNIYGGLASRCQHVAYAANITGLGAAFQKNGFLRKIVVLLYKSALKKARVVFFENCANLNLLLREKIVKKDQVCLLNGAGVNLKHYSFESYPQTEDGVTHFLFIGRIMREKGIDELFWAMETLRAHGETCVLDVVGEFEEDYAAVIEQYEAEGWLHYHGYQRDVRPFIRAAHCFVLPSWHEGMANTNLECAASGRPIITSNIPGCREAVTPESGILCESRNRDSLYRAMKQFLSLSKETREAMGKAGRAHMEAVFDKRIVVGETMKGLNV